METTVVWTPSQHFIFNISRSSKTTYAKQNGGKYNFIVEKSQALPQDQVRTLFYLLGLRLKIYSNFSEFYICRFFFSNFGQTSLIRWNDGSLATTCRWDFWVYERFGHVYSVKNRAMLPHPLMFRLHWALSISSDGHR